jgi:FkbM family methyltransferase
VGANPGEFTTAASRLSRLEKVHAFEPQVECHSQLQRMLAAIPNGHLHPAAVGTWQGEIELLCTANSKMASVLAEPSQILAV